MQNMIHKQWLNFNLNSGHAAVLPAILILAGFLCAPDAAAQVYKCTSFDKATQQNKTVYTDEPCAKSAKQSLTHIQAQTRLPANQAPADETLAEKNASLDKAVTEALLNKNFALAQSLAQTKEHWRMIAVAQKANPPVTLATTQYTNQNAQLNACAQAKSDYEYTARTDWRDNALVAMKKDEMDAVCGGASPQVVQNSVIGGGQFYNYPYGGVGASRWIGGQRFRGGYPNDKYFNGRPHRPSQHPQIQRQSGTRSEHATTFYKRN